MNPFPTGTEMNLRLTKNGKSFHTKARVTYCESGVGMGSYLPKLLRHNVLCWKGGSPNCEVNRRQNRPL
jgi:hypothetical protein